MENKYFIPNIEDLHVGYEGEYHNWCMDESGKPELNYDRWDKVILTNSNVETMLKYGVNHFRVPYLTKEQIEAEGWTYNEQYKTYHKVKNIESGYSIYFNTNKMLVSYNGDCIFYGECKDINTFRYICKLLKI